MDGDGKLVSRPWWKAAIELVYNNVSKESITFLEALEILKDASSAVDSTVHLRGEFPKEFPLPRVLLVRLWPRRRRWSWRFAIASCSAHRSITGRVRPLLSSRAGSLKVNKEAAEGDVRCAFAALRAGANVSMG